LLQLIDEALNAVTLTVSVSVAVGQAPFVVRGWDDGADPARRKVSRILRLL
jgi:hypothetical protein